MSTDEIIKMVDNYCQERVLFALNPLVSADPIIRHIFVTREIHGMLNGPWKNELEENQWNTVASTMDSFVAGRLMSLADNEKPNKNRHKLARLEPKEDGLWEIRATDPRPGVRIVGYFVKKDVFIALTWATRLFLGSVDSLQWRWIMIKSKREWKKLFLEYTPLTGGGPNDYVSNIIIN
ncbi:MAG: hypothetical protein KJ017_11410 [Alphaproteobacteria bacterium]|nr:hypothetical protein [Alphaproteobacteria bacterium]